VIRDYGDDLKDILDALDETAEFTHGMSFEDFTQDRKTINAVLRSLEVIGEAAKRIPDELRAQVSAVPWKHMAGMRDKLVHEFPHRHWVFFDPQDPPPLLPA
jgi:uncharacterized protein with HEPN domain